MSPNAGAAPRLTPEQQRLNDLWEEHLRDEFVARDTDATLGTMVPDAYVNHVPVMTGGVGREALRGFYSRLFIPRMPPDTEIVPVSRTIGTDRLVDEMVFRFTHSSGFSPRPVYPSRASTRRGRSWIPACPRTS